MSIAGYLKFHVQRTSKGITMFQLTGMLSPPSIGWYGKGEGKLWWDDNVLKAGEHFSVGHWKALIDRERRLTEPEEKYYRGRENFNLARGMQCMNREYFHGAGEKCNVKEGGGRGW